MNMAARQRWQKTSRLPLLEEAALHWCAVQSAWTGWWLHLVPLLLANTTSPLLGMLEMAGQHSHYSSNGLEDVAPKLLVPLWNTAIICCIVCRQLHVKHTFPTKIGWVVLTLLVLALLSGQMAARLIIDQYSMKGSHKHAASCAISSFFHYISLPMVIIKV